MAGLLCGVDLGGTKLSVGLVDDGGQVRDRLVAYDHIRKSESELILQIRDMIRALLERGGLAEADLAGIGVGFAGHLRYREGVVITTSNFPAFKLKNFPIRQAIQDHFSIPVMVDNDANAQSWAEFLFGAGRPYDTMIFLTISTGIGAGLVLNRRIYRGMTGTAGEFGHTIVHPESDIRCGCGNYGCLMSHASGLALPQLVRKKLQTGLRSSLHLETAQEIDGQLLGRGLEAGDELCRAVILECADFIGIGVYNLFQIFNPPVIVLGGGLTNWGPLYIRRIEEKFRALAGDMLFDPMAIALASTGRDAGLIGAAALLLEEQ
jgi:glucokinase